MKYRCSQESTACPQCLRDMSKVKLHRVKVQDALMTRSTDDTWQLRPAAACTRAAGI